MSKTQPININKNLKRRTVYNTPPPVDLSQGYIPAEDDPLANILGPGTTGVLGKQGEEIPEEILSVFAEHDLGKKQFRAILKSIPDGCTENDPNLPYVKAWTRQVPSIEFIAREYGPGVYKLVFSWRTVQDVNHKYATEYVLITVSEKYTQEYKDHQFEKKIKEIEKRRERVRDLKLDGELEKTLGLSDVTEKKPDAPPVEEAALAYVKNVTNMAEQMGLTRQRQGMDWDKLLPIVVTGLPAILKMMQDAENSRREENRQFMTLLISTMTNNSNQMVDILKSQQNPRGADLTKEMFDMIRGAIDVKEMIQGSGKESIADRIFNVVEGIAPQLLEVAKLSAAQRAQDPRVLLAKTYMQADKDFRQLNESPMIRSEVIHRMDEVFGWRQTDAVLSAIGMERNSDCDRDPGKELPVDQRETPVEKEHTESMDEESPLTSGE